MSTAKRDLCAAVASGDMKSVQQLLERGAEVNQHSREDFAPLCIAAFWGYDDIVEHLLKHGADVNIANRGTGWTPCHCAAFQGHGKVLLYLMPYKPDVTVQDSEGRTAADFGSAQDGIWSYFSSLGCKRTPKKELIRLNIVKKVSVDMSSQTPASKTPLSRAAHMSRPGSAYVIQPQMLLHHNSSTAPSYGDVLKEVDERF